MSLKHQITSFHNHGVTGEAHERPKHLHSSAVCAAADKLLWLLAVFLRI